MVENNKDPFQRVPSHTHNGVDSPQIDGRSFVGTPFPAITAQSGSLSTGGGAVLSTSDSDTIVNTINRVTEIEDLLRTIGLII